MLDEVVGVLSRIAVSWRGRGLVAARVRVGVVALVAMVAMVAATFVALPYLQVTVGALAGLVLFGAAYVGWASALPDGQRERLNFRGRWELPRRRMAFLWGTLAWAAFALLVGRYTGGPVMGGLTVAVVLSLWRMASATPAERAALEQEMEEYELWRLESAAESENADGRAAPKRRFFRM